MNPKPLADTLNAGCTEVREIGSPHVPENPVARQSDESKPGRGGKRPGAGRKPNLANRLLKGFTRDAIALAVEDLDVKTVIIGLLKSKSDRTRLETLAFLRDTLHGRPAQSVSFSGGLIHAHTNWRPLENLTDEEFLLLDSITKKLNPSADLSDASQDGSQNQIESKPATLAPRPESNRVE
jgi:hypothetical protein